MSLPPSLPNAKPRNSSGTWILLALVGLTFVALCGVVVFRMTQPKWYMSQVTLELAEPETTLEFLWKPEALDLVVRNLELTRPSLGDGSVTTPERAREQLRRSMRVEAVRHTPSLTTITVYNQDPNMAASIANTLAVTYRNHRLEAGQVGLERSLSVYKDEVGKQLETVRALAAERQQIRERDQVTDPDPEQAGTVLAGEKTGDYEAAKQKYLQAKRIAEQAEVALSKARMEAMIDQEPVRVRQRAEPARQPLPWWQGDPRS